MKVLKLNVGPVSLAAAQELRRVCPWVKFTSGWRSWWSQANAMAVNTTKKRSWCGEVYKKQPEIQDWIDENPDVTEVGPLTLGIYDVLSKLPAEMRVRFAHPAGRAWDLEAPKPEHQGPTIAKIRSLDGLERFLEGEAGLPIWHCQFIENAVPGAN
jgi:hypothetical protein